MFDNNHGIYFQTHYKLDQLIRTSASGESTTNHHHPSTQIDRNALDQLQSPHPHPLSSSKLKFKRSET